MTLLSAAMARDRRHDRSEAAAEENRAAPDLGRELDLIDGATLAELVRRIADIDHSYREVAENMGQLYMLADSLSARELTRRLDEPMRNASRNELVLRILLDELQVRAQRRSQSAAHETFAPARRSRR